MFTNWTDEDFTHTWDGTAYELPKKTPVMLQDFLALHFAKHLAIREMNKMTESWMEKDARFIALMQKCFGSSAKIEARSEVELEKELLNNADAPKKKGGRPKKEVELEKEEVFEGLLDETPKQD